METEYIWFTLGIVALTLSPVMSAYLLKGGQEEHGLAGRINRAFDRIKAVYGRHLESSFRARGAIYAAWVVVSLLAVAMFTMAPKELAPAEDQGVIFGVVNTPANSTLDQVMYSTREVDRVVADTVRRTGQDEAYVRSWHPWAGDAERIVQAIGEYVDAGIDYFIVNVPNAFEGGVISRFAEEIFPRLGLRVGLKPA